MKVKCIDNGYWLDITIDKIYEVIEYNSDDDYWIINDNGDKLGYDKIYFKPLAEMRNETINKLLEG